MRGHKITKLGRGNLTFRGCSGNSGGAIRVSGGGVSWEHSCVLKNCLIVPGGSFNYPHFGDFFCWDQHCTSMVIYRDFPYNSANSALFGLVIY